MHSIKDKINIAIHACFDLYKKAKYVNINYLISIFALIIINLINFFKNQFLIKLHALVVHCHLEMEFSCNYTFLYTNIILPSF